MQGFRGNRGCNPEEVSVRWVPGAVEAFVCGNEHSHCEDQADHNDENCLSKEGDLAALSR